MVKGQKWLHYRCFCTQNVAFRDFYEVDRYLYEVDQVDRSLLKVDLNLYEVDCNLYEVNRSLYEVDILFYNQCQLDYFFLPMTISITKNMKKTISNMR